MTTNEIDMHYLLSNVNESDLRNMTINLAVYFSIKDNKYEDVKNTNQYYFKISFQEELLKKLCKLPCNCLQCYHQTNNQKHYQDSLDAYNNL